LMNIKWLHFFFFLVIRCLTLARLVLYQLSHSSSPLCVYVY
jgi:hypothetical protein